MLIFFKYFARSIWGADKVVSWSHSMLMNPQTVMLRNRPHHEESRLTSCSFLDPIFKKFGRRPSRMRICFKKIKCGMMVSIRGVRPFLDNLERGKPRGVCFLAAVKRKVQDYWWFAKQKNLWTSKQLMFFHSKRECSRCLERYGLTILDFTIVTYLLPYNIL